MTNTPKLYESKRERQLTVYLWEIGFEEFTKAPDGRYDLKRVPVCLVEESNITRTDARRIIAEHGYEAPRDMDVYAKKLKKFLWHFRNDELRAISTVEEVPISQEVKEINYALR